MKKISVTGMGFEDAMEMGIMSVALVKVFERRGYGLYSLGTGGPILFSSLAQIDEFIQFGREKLMMDDSVRYLVLPLVDQDANPAAVMQCVGVMVQEMRGPYFFDIVQETVDTMPVCRGRYLVDSVKLTNFALELTIDVRYGNPSGNTIEIPITEAANVIDKQLMLALRKGSSNGKEIRQS